MQQNQWDIALDVLCNSIQQLNLRYIKLVVTIEKRKQGQVNAKFTNWVGFNPIRPSKIALESA